MIMNCWEIFRHDQIDQSVNCYTTICLITFYEFHQLKPTRVPRFINQIYNEVNSKIRQNNMNATAKTPE